MYYRDKDLATHINSPFQDEFSANNSQDLIFPQITDSHLRKIIYLFVVSCLFLISSSFTLYSQQEAGGYSSSYLLRSQGVRASSLGGAFTAISNDPSTIFVNPAGIGFLSNKTIISSSVGVLGLGKTHSTIAWAQRIHPNFGLGIGINSMNSGSFIGRDVLGNSLGELTDWQYAMSLSASYRLEMVSVGATVKYLRHSLLGSDINASGTAIDIGSKFDVMNMFTFAIAIQNIGSQIFWNKHDPIQGAINEALPYSVRAGVAMEFGLNDEYLTQRSEKTGKIETVYLPASKYLLVDIDALMYQFDKSPRYMIGTEAVIDDRVVLRGGLTIWGEDQGKVQFFPLNNWGAGISLRPNLPQIPFKFMIDYSINQEYISHTGVSNNIGIVVEF